MMKAVGHIGISTPNLKRLMDFYIKQMGCVEIGQLEWPVGTDRVDKVVGLRGSSAKNSMVRLGDVCIEFFEFAAPKPKTKPKDYPANDHGISHFCFLVEDIHAEYDRLSAVGVPFNTEPQKFDGVWATYGRDPDGNIFELMQMEAGTENPMQTTVKNW